MKQLLMGALCVSFLLPSILHGEAKTYDFEFKQVDIRKIISSLAKLEGKSIQFTQNVVSKPIDVSLKEVTPDFAINVILESYGYVAVPKGSIYHVMTIQERKPGARPMIVVPMKHVLADEIETAVKSYVGDMGTVSVNKAMNALILSVSDESAAKILEVIDKLDKEPSQVFIDAMIVKTTRTFSRALGLEWGPNLGNRYEGVNFRYPVGENEVLGGFKAAIGDSLAIQTRIQTGERNGEAKVISQPKISTLSGVPASIDSNITFNIKTAASAATTVVTSGAANPNNPAGQAAGNGGIQTVSAGLKLRVTPFIVSDDKVRLTIDVSKSEPDFSNRVDGIPAISDDSATTSVIVNNGQMASIGGLISQTKSDSTAGVPILRDLPFVGMVFGNSEKEKKDLELLIFLTPHVYKASAN